MKISAAPNQTFPSFDPESYVRQTAQLLGLTISPKHLANVVENFEQIRAIAQPVLDFPLPDTLEAAPQFEPSEPSEPSDPKLNGVEPCP